MQYHAEKPESAASPRPRRFKWLAVPSGLAAVLCAILPSSCAKSVMRDLVLNVAAEVIAPEVPKLFEKLGSAAPSSQDPAARLRAEQLVGLTFAQDLVREQGYWCDSQELKQACVERISRLAAADFQVTLIHWDQSVEECRDAAATSTTNPHSDEIKMHDEFFACMEQEGFGRQIAALRAAEPDGT